MSAVIRRATNADAELISALNAEVQALHAKALPHWFKPPDAASFPPSTAAALIANPNNFVLVAEVESAPVGYAYAEIVRHPETPWRYAQELVYLHQIGVRAAFRRQGVGQALLAELRAAAGEAGIAHVALDVWAFNQDARAFFRRCGFAPYNERFWSPARGRGGAQSPA
jgi:ribosomal protein S18 acetylase RimI-like enzyme